MLNCSGDGTFARTLHQAADTLPVGIIVLFSALNYFLSITASLGNALILIALRKVSSLRPPIKQLFQCLALTDLCVGLISQPLFATIMLNAVAKMELDTVSRIRQIIYASGSTLCHVSIFTSTAVSVDRLVLLLLGLHRYKNIFTLRRVRAVVICLWLVGISLGIMHCFCSYRRISFIASPVFSLLCVCISIFSYTKIFLTLRQYQNIMQQSVRQSNEAGTSLNIDRYRRIVFSIAWLQLALVACHVPKIFVVIIIKISDWSGTITADIIWRSTITLLFAKSSLNPILYCWTIKEVKQVVKAIMKQFCCSSNQ